MKIIFFGTPEFAVESLRTIIDNGYDVAAVVTMPDRIGGRGKKLIESDVKKFALERQLPILQPERLRDPEFLDTLRRFDADLFIVIAFRMLPEVVWKMPRLGTFNLHASLLPQLRGAAPINHAIISGMQRTGVTTFMIDAEIDKGHILMSESVEISAEETAGSLHDRLMSIGAKLVVKTIKGLEDGSLIPLPQNDSLALTPAPKIFKENCRIDFFMSAAEIDRLVRGLYPYPAAWCRITLEEGKSFDAKILKVKPSETLSEGSPGVCRADGKRLFVAAKDFELEILELQPAGKKPMDARAFLAGYRPEKFD